MNNQPPYALTGAEVIQDFVRLAAGLTERAQALRHRHGPVLVGATNAVDRAIGGITRSIESGDLVGLRYYADRAVIAWQGCQGLSVTWRDRSDAFWVATDLRDLAYDLVEWLWLFDVLPPKSESPSLREQATDNEQPSHGDSSR